ncbi:hypothetical protein A5641_12195 [Mycobacterium sp. 1554424.7]|nr:hypothetical protein A5641_12195 [Mycobacterium sp. 1554424.7]
MAGRFAASRRTVLRMARTAPTKAQLDELAEIHLYYEVAMLRGGRAEQDRHRDQRHDLMSLDRADPARVATMAFFEAALMHARVLNDFLTVPPSERNRDDVWAGDYVTNWRPPNPGPLERVPPVISGQPVRDSINKQLAHFSLLRLQQTKFYVGLVADEVTRDMKDFAENPNNVCHQSLQGVRDLLNRTHWQTVS